MTTRASLAIAACAALLSSCTQDKSSSDEAIRSYVREVTGDDLKVPGRLQVSTNDVTTDGRIAKIRGSVQNKFDQTVHGIRYMVVIYNEGPPPRVLDRWQREVDTTIEPGRRTMMSLDAESMYFGSAAGKFGIIAEPVKVGDKEMPPPEGWR